MNTETAKPAISSLSDEDIRKILNEDPVFIREKSNPSPKKVVPYGGTGTVRIRDLTKTPAPTSPGSFVSGCLVAKSVNDWNEEASRRPAPRQLWNQLWFEGEICCLFADSNLGKSIMAVQIGENIAATQKVIYFDFEMLDKQFQLRYTNEETGRTFAFNPNFMRATINRESTPDAEFEDYIMLSIESLSLQVGAKVLIIDNLTFLCNGSESGDAAGVFMASLMNLKRKHGWSILVISHTPKRDLTMPITQNDLAGSKRLFNFFDSVFTIGASARDNALRYIKQLKARACPIEYDASNVMLCDIVMHESGFLHFRKIGFAPEQAHLKVKEGAQKDARALAAALRQQGKTNREIAVELGISERTVTRYLNH